jgi:hypothetical protein
MIDKHDLDAYEAEYKQLALAELTDDITIDIKADVLRELRLHAITEQVGYPTTEAWQESVYEQARKHGYASGKPFED